MTGWSGEIVWAAYVRSYLEHLGGTSQKAMNNIFRSVLSVASSVHHPRRS